MPASWVPSKTYLSFWIGWIRNRDARVSAKKCVVPNVSLAVIKFSNDRNTAFGAGPNLIAVYYFHPFTNIYM